MTQRRDSKPAPRRSRARPKPRTSCGICSPRWTRWSRPSSRRPRWCAPASSSEAATLEADQDRARAPLCRRHRAGEGEPAGPVASTCPICSPRCASSTTRSTRCCRSTSRCWRPRTRSPKGSMRGAHAEVARKNAPQTYGQSGRADGAAAQAPRRRSRSAARSDASSIASSVNRRRDLTHIHR